MAKFIKVVILYGDEKIETPSLLNIDDIHRFYKFDGELWVELKERDPEDKERYGYLIKETAGDISKALGGEVTVITI